MGMKVGKQLGVVAGISAALLVGGGVTYAAVGQGQPDTVQVRTVTSETADQPVEQPSPSPSQSETTVKPVEEPKPVESTAPKRQSQPVEQQAPAVDSAPAAPKAKDEPVTQPQQPAEQPKQQAKDDDAISPVTTRAGKVITPPSPEKIEKNDPPLPEVPEQYR